MVNIRKLEADLWESADLLRAGSKLTSNQYRISGYRQWSHEYVYARHKDAA